MRNEQLEFGFFTAPALSCNGAVLEFDFQTKLLHAGRRLSRS